LCKELEIKSLIASSRSGMTHSKLTHYFVTLPWVIPARLEEASGLVPISIKIELDSFIFCIIKYLERIYLGRIRRVYTIVF